MKKIILFFFATIVALQAYSQDVIVKTDGSTILAKVLEVNSNDIKYKKHSNPKGPTYTVNKSEVMSINYQNGDKDIFNAITSDSTPAKANSTPKQLSPEDIEANNLYLSNFNQQNDAHYIGEINKKPKNAKVIFGILQATPDSKMIDQNVELSFKVARVASETSGGSGEFAYGSPFYTRGSALMVQITNKTDQIVYVDLANCFFGRNTNSVPYYIPQATSVYDGTSSGTSVNLGAVAGAMGVGGALGTLANGVNVSGGKTSGEKTVTYSQRIVAIPPQSSIDLPKVELFTSRASDFFGPIITAQDVPGYGAKPCLMYYENDKIKIGEERVFSSEISPFKFSFHISYSFDETISSKNSLKATLFTHKMIGVHNYKGSAWINEKDLSENASQVISFAIDQNKHWFLVNPFQRVLLELA